MLPQYILIFASIGFCSCWASSGKNGTSDEKPDAGDDIDTGPVSTDDEGTESDTDTTSDIASLCEDSFSTDCESAGQGRPMELLLSLGEVGLDSGVITHGAVRTREVFSDGLDIGVIGVDSSEDNKRVFLLVFSSSDPQEHTINWLEVENLQRIVGLRRDEETDRWLAIVCGDTCRLAESAATSAESTPLVISEGVESLPDMNPVALVDGYSHSVAMAVGNGIVRLEKDGRWTTLIANDGKTTYAAANSIDDDNFVAVGGNGLITHYRDGVMKDLPTGSSDKFISVWAREFIENTDQKVEHLIVYALSDRGTIYLSDASGNRATCPYIDDGLVILQAYNVLTATSDGEIFTTSNTVNGITMCPYGSFGGVISGARSTMCGIIPNLLGWNQSQVFASAYLFCAVD